MPRKRSDARVQADRVAKVQRLALDAGTPGEAQAALVALERMSAGGIAGKPQSLTDATVRGLLAPAKGNQVVWDADPRGFGIRITAGGHRSFVLNYRTKSSSQQRRITIGGFPSWTTAAARTEARRLKRLVDGGGDPLGHLEEQRTAPSVWDLADRFEREQLPKKRPATRISYKRLLDLHIRPFFGKHKKVDDVRFADVDSMHSAITKKGSVYSANRAVAVFSRMMNLAVQWEWRTTNPCKGVEKNPEVKRKRYLSADELKRLTAALAGHTDKQLVDVVRLLLLTGARKSEVLGMKWVDLDLNKGIWTRLGATTKQRTDHIAPLSAPAVGLLKAIKRRGDWVFPGDGVTGHVVEIKKGWASICKTAGITGLRLHDLRHSFASHLVSEGASLALIGSLLGHASPTTTHRYAHLLDDPQRKAVEKIAKVVAGNGKAKGGRRHG